MQGSVFQVCGLQGQCVSGLRASGLCASGFWASGLRVSDLFGCVFQTCGLRGCVFQTCGFQGCGAACFRLAGFGAACFRLVGFRAAGLRVSGLRASGLRVSDLWVSGLRGCAFSGLRASGLRVSGLWASVLRGCGLQTCFCLRLGCRCASPAVCLQGCSYSAFQACGFEGCFARLRASKAHSEPSLLSPQPNSRKSFRSAQKRKIQTDAFRHATSTFRQGTGTFRHATHGSDFGHFWSTFCATLCGPKHAKPATRSVDPEVSEAMALNRDVHSAGTLESGLSFLLRSASKDDVASLQQVAKEP